MTGDQRIVDLAEQPASMLDQAATLLSDGFDEPRAWPTLGLARDEVNGILNNGFARALIEDGQLLGWIGGLPAYDGRVWELHPLVVHRHRRRSGIGRALVAEFEAEARRRGGVTATLGTDDEAGMTSLGNIDLYDDVPRRIAELRDLGRQHPFLFYQRLGYVVTGVLPDANGWGRPDIFMSKRLTD